MSYFPFFIELEGKCCLVAGGGEVAYRKIKALLPFEIKIHVVAPKYCAQLEALRSNAEYAGKLKFSQRAFCEQDLEGILFAIAATDDAKLHEKMYDLCQERNILINVVDKKELCSFYFPSLVKENELVVGISSGGNSPVLAKRLRKRVEQTVPEYYAQLNEQLGGLREAVMQSIPDEAARKQCFEALADMGEQKGRKLEQTEIEEILRQFGGHT